MTLADPVDPSFSLRDPGTSIVPEGSGRGQGGRLPHQRAGRLRAVQVRALGQGQRGDPGEVPRLLHGRPPAARQGRVQDLQRGVGPGHGLPRQGHRCHHRRLGPVRGLQGRPGHLQEPARSGRDVHPDRVFQHGLRALQEEGGPAGHQLRRRPGADHQETPQGQGLPGDELAAHQLAGLRQERANPTRTTPRRPRSSWPRPATPTGSPSIRPSAPATRAGAWGSTRPCCRTSRRSASPSRSSRWKARPWWSATRRANSRPSSGPWARGRTSWGR